MPTKQFQVQSSSGRGTKFYTVSEASDGHWECSCPNWTRTYPRQDCKHILMKRLDLKVPVMPVVAGVKTLGATAGRKFRD